MLPPWGPFTLWYPGLNWVAAPQVALGMWLGLYPNPPEPYWFTQDFGEVSMAPVGAAGMQMAEVPMQAPSTRPGEAATTVERIRTGAVSPGTAAAPVGRMGPGAQPGPGFGAAPLGPGLPYGVGLGTSPGIPGTPIGPLTGQGGPVGPGQTLQWLSTHYLPARIPGAEPLGPIFGSGIGLPGMPIGTGSFGAGGRPIAPGGIGGVGGGRNVGAPGIGR
jgi:hypothetical protein